MWGRLLRCPWQYPNFKKHFSMLVNLPNGRTVDMPVDDYLRIGNDGYQFLVAQNFGAIIESPFFASILYVKGVYEEVEEEEEDEPEDDYTLPETFEE